MRALGLILLIGVHVNAPDWYVAVRSFDVPLMVFISAMCYKPLRGGIVTYWLKRFKRIYIPVVVFLIIYFAAAIGSRTLNIHDQSAIKIILGSFLLLEPSIGFVWVMRVFLLMAIIMPFLYKITQCHKYAWAISIIGLIIFQSLVANLKIFNQNTINYLIGNQIVLYAVGYSPIAILGLVISRLPVQQISRCILISIFALILIMTCSQIGFCPQIFKYPPCSIFQIYGVLMCSLIWICRPTKEWNGIAEKCIPLIAYLSKNSMWIYLWHIMGLALMWMVNRMLPMPWIARYCFVVLIAIMITWAYNKTISYLPKRLYNLLK